MKKRALILLVLLVFLLGCTEEEVLPEEEPEEITEPKEEPEPREEIEDIYRDVYGVKRPEKMGPMQEDINFLEDTSTYLFKEKENEYCELETLEEDVIGRVQPKIVLRCDGMAAWRSIMVKEIETFDAHQLRFLATLTLNPEGLFHAKYSDDIVSLIILSKDPRRMLDACKEACKNNICEPADWEKCILPTDRYKTNVIGYCDVAKGKTEEKCGFDVRRGYGDKVYAVFQINDIWATENIEASISDVRMFRKYVG